jgi:hypothetical protein
MARKVILPPTLDQAISWLREHSFDVVPAATGSFRVTKYGCACVLAAGLSPLKQKCAIIAQRPGILLGGEIGTIIDRGYQKFVGNSKLEVTATADHLRSLHVFQEELAQAIGRDQIYNEALGTVSDEYLYDRLKGRADIQP